MFLSSGEFFGALEKKNFFWREKELKKKNLLQRDFFWKPKRELFLYRKRIHPYQKSNKSQKQKQSSFLLLSLLKVAFKPKKARISIFKPRTNQNGEHPLKGNQYCINIFFYSFLYYLLFFVVLFNFLFDSIYFYFCIDYLLIIFLLFLIFWWVEWCESMVEVHKYPWYAMG